MAVDDSGVSVVITCYNLEAYIAASIDSVLSQEYAGALQVIVVDDASTDSSLQIIRGYTQVEVVSLGHNHGVLLSTLAGIAHSRYEVILFLDGDDIWLPSKLQLVMQTFNLNKDIGLVTHDIDFIGKTGRRVKREARPSQVLSAANDSGVLVKKGILNHSDYVWLGSAYAVRRDSVDLSGFIRWAKNLPNPFETYQDWPLAYWCASINSVKCAYIDQKLMLYRLHGANYSGDSRTLDKAIRNLRKGHFTAMAICGICRLRGLNGFPYMFSRGKELYYSYMLDLYSSRWLLALFKFGLLQAYFIVSPHSFLREWTRFLAITLIGPRRFTSVLKG